MPSSATIVPDSLATRSSLVLRLRNTGDQEAWETFYSRYRRFLFNVARRKGLDDQFAEDVVQDTVISVMKAMPDFCYDRSRSSFKNWLSVIMWRRVIDAGRRRQRRPWEGDAGNAESLEQVADPAGSPDEAWDREWQEEWLAMAVTRVRERASPEAFRLWHECAVRGVKPRDTARTFGVSAARVHLAKHRVAALIRKELRAVESELENFAAARLAGTTPPRHG